MEITKLLEVSLGQPAVRVLSYQPDGTLQVWGLRSC